MRTKEEYIALVDETASFYHTKNRGVFKGTCIYHTAKGNMCAVGRCLEDAKEFQEMINETSGVGATDIGGLFTDGFAKQEDFKEEYRGYHPSFWNGLQSLHDSDGYWDANGITEKGETYKEWLMLHIEKNFSTWNDVAKELS